VLDRLCETGWRHAGSARWGHRDSDHILKAYAVVVDDGVVLADTGLPGRANKVVAAIGAARRRIGDVHTILLTHWHRRSCRRRSRVAPPLGCSDRCSCS
jgi:hypothetical protein